MPVRRIQSYPYPEKLESVKDVEKYLEKLYAAQWRESTERIQDFDWLQISHKPVVDVREYGASPNASAAMNSVAIQSAFNAATQSAGLTKGSTVVFPPGRYLMDAGITVSQPANGLLIQGRGATLIAGTAGIKMLTIGSSGAVTSCTDSITIDGLFIDGNNLAATAIDLGFTHFTSIRNTYIIRCTGDGIIYTGEYGLTLDNVNVTFCNRGFHAYPGVTVFDRDNINFLNCFFTDNTEENVLLETCNIVTFINGGYGRGTAGIAITANCRNVNIIGGGFERGSIADIYVYKDSPSSAAIGVVGLNIKGSFFSGNALMPVAIKLLGASTVNIDNIYSELHTAGCFDFDNTGLSVEVNRDISVSNFRTYDPAIFVHQDGLLSALQAGLGFYLPQYTTAERNLLTVRPGTIIYNSTTSKSQVWEGGIWNDII